MSVRAVIDTNILVSVLMSRDNMCRRLLRDVFYGHLKPIVGNAMFCEYESLMGRDELFDRRSSPYDREKRDEFLDNFLAMCKWVDVQYLWRPNLYDEGDNHVLELAVAGAADMIITQNIKDFKRADLLFDHIQIIKPEQYFNKERWH